MCHLIINSFKSIKRKITFKYLGIIYLSTLLNPVLATRSVINIRWTVASIIYIIFIIKLYEFLKSFFHDNFLVKKILGEDKSLDLKNYPNKYISLLSIILIVILFYQYIHILYIIF